MRIAILGDGSLRHTERWCEFFQSRGHRVMLFTFEEPKAFPVPVASFKKALPTNLLGYLSSLGRLRKALDNYRPDMVNSLYVSGYGLLGALSGHRPLVVSALGSDLLIDYRRHLIHKAQIEYAIKKADLITTDSESLSKAAAEAGAPREKVLKVYLGIDEEIFYPSSKDEDSGEGADGPIVISTRNLYPIYGIGLLIEAAPRILEKTRAKFVICGDGPEREKLEKKAAELGLGEHMTFTGKLSANQLAEELRAGDIYVSTSLSDSTSVSLLEAMACGLFPVITDIDANREWINDGENGIILGSRNSESLAEAILRVARNKPLAEKARKTNFEIIRNRGLWIPNMERLERAMTNLVAAGG